MQRKLIVVMAAVVITAIVVQMVQHSRVASAELARFRAIARGVSEAPSMVVHVGIPSATPGKAGGGVGVGRESVRIQGQDFLARPVAPSPEDVETLRRLCATTSSYHSLTANKNGGGYHAEYAMVWHGKGQTWQLLLCLGRREMKLYGPGGMVHVDVNWDALRELRSILGKYGAQRERVSLSEEAVDALGT